MMKLETLEFAKSELNKYLLKMTGEEGKISLFAGEDGDLFRERSEICVKEGRGSISANCPRALLLGVYEFLKSAVADLCTRAKNGGIHPLQKIFPK